MKIKYKPILGNRYNIIAMENKWSVSGTENGTQRAENWASRNGTVSGGHRLID